jgi:hypothetical protein
LLVVLFVGAAADIDRAEIGCHTDFDADGEGEVRGEAAGTSLCLGSSTGSETDAISGGVGGVCVRGGALSFLEVPHISQLSSASLAGTKKISFANSFSESLSKASIASREVQTSLL